MADYSTSEVKTFTSERDLNDFLRSGSVGEIIAIVPKVTYFVIFYTPKSAEVTIKKTKKGEK